MGLYAIFSARTATAGESDSLVPVRPAAAFWGTAAITALNPKTIVFFVAFTPQFISADYGYWPQAGVLLATFCAVVTLSDGFYAAAASWVAGLLKGPKVHLWSKRVGGLVLMAAGLVTAAAA
jgi:threonine/homoserine/homoserine lactone efflux protein